MITLGVSLLAVACLASVQAKTYDYKTVVGDPTQMRIYTLDNGLKVYMSVNKDRPRIQTYIAVRTGSKNDPAETTGLAHYLEHIMFKGTTNFGSSNVDAERPLLDSIRSRFEQYRHITDPAERKAFYHEIDSISQLAAVYNIPNEYDKLMASIGSEGSNAFTSNDVTCYQEDIPANELDSWARVQADRFQNMVIRGFHTELEAVYEEYNIGLSNDFEKEYVAMSKKLFPNHPYGTQTTIGTQEHLKNPSIVNIEGYFSRYYVPNNVAICLAGDLDPDKTIALLDKYFGSWKKSDSLQLPTFAPCPDLTTHTDTTVIGLEAENVMIGWKMAGAASQQADTLGVLANLLYNGNAGLMDLNLNQQMRLMASQAMDDELADYSSLILIGMPSEGQTLDEVKQLLLGEMENLKKGNFSDDLLPSTVNNVKREYYRSLQSNQKRAMQAVDAFVTGKTWEDVTDYIQRIEGMTKQQIVDFANRHFGDNYVCVFKQQGVDSTQHKIDKPEITPIPTNNDKQSDFLREIANAKTEPIQPQFVDYDKELTFATTKNGLPVIYKQDVSGKLFTLNYYFDFGKEADKRYEMAAAYLDYLGTDKLSAQDIRQAFYKLACDYSVTVGNRNIAIELEGLAENMPQAVALLENVLANVKADDKTYDMFTELVVKSRSDEKTEQNACFSALRHYGTYGGYNPQRNTMTNEELCEADPQELVSLVRDIFGYKHTVLYCGPADLNTLDKLISKEHKTGKRLADVPENKHYTAQTTPTTEVILAPYDAKNIYMSMIHNDATEWTPERAPMIALFNEYFGGGMNTVVFQELRETRGLAYSAAAIYEQPQYKDQKESVRTYIISQNDKMPECVRVFNQIIDTIPQNEAAFNLAKQSLLKQLASRRVLRADVIGSYLSAKGRGLDYDINRDIYNKVSDITLQQLVDFERQTMAGKNYRYIILGDEKNLDMDFLNSIAPVKRVTTDETFGY